MNKFLLVFPAALVVSTLGIAAGTNQKPAAVSIRSKGRSRLTKA